MPEKSMKEKLAAAELVLCMNLRLARSVDIAMMPRSAREWQAGEIALSN